MSSIQHSNWVKSRGTAVRRMLRRAPPTAWFGMIVVLGYLLAALFAPYIAPYGEYEVVSDSPYEPWSAQFVFGTDQLGRDLFSRVIYGARNSIGIAFVTDRKSTRLNSSH